MGFLKCFGNKTKSYHCKIVFLDDTELLQEIQTSTLGQDLLDVAFKHLNLLETAYFGLRFLDKTNQTHWLDGGKKVTQQLKGTDPFTLYFGVKFYASDPCKLLEEITRYQFFLQVKQDVLQERLPVLFELAAELASYAVQSELGDYDPRRHQPGYINEFKFVAQQTTQFENRVSELHKNMIGQVPAIAELNYLEKVKWLDMYGVDLHPVLGEDNVEYFLGLTPSGVIVLRNKSKVGNYFWPRITKVYFKGKYFMLRVRDKNNDDSTYGFELPSKQACKHLWKCCVEHHSFFRLTQVCPSSNGKAFGLHTRFSGRSDKSAHLGAHLPHPFGLNSSRSQPQVVRVASRRYQRRFGQPDGIDSNLKDDKDNEKLETRSNISIPQPVHLPKSVSVPALPDSPRSVRSAPWEDPRQRGLFSSSTNPSPRSVRSAGWRLPSKSSSRHRHRSPSVESDDSCDSRRRRHGHHHRHHRSRRNSDNESEKSVGVSKHSHSHSHSRKHGDRSYNFHHKDTVSEIDVSQKNRYADKPTRSSSNYELIDSEAQWSEVQRQRHINHQTRKSQNAVIRDLSSRKSGYTNSGMESEPEVNYLNRKRNRKHRSRSPTNESRHSKGPPPELRKHIAYELIEPTSDNQLRDIPFTNVETEGKPFKVRTRTSSSSRHAYPKSGNVSSEMKVRLQTDDGEDSPPPPYTPTVSESVTEQGQLRFAKGESHDGESKTKIDESSANRSKTIGGNSGPHPSSHLYDLDLISTHSKSNPPPFTSTTHSATTNNINGFTHATVKSTLLNSTGVKAGNQKTPSTNNLSEEFGHRNPIAVNGVPNYSSEGYAFESHSNRHQDMVENMHRPFENSNSVNQSRSNNSHFAPLTNGYNHPQSFVPQMTNDNHVYASSHHTSGLPTNYSSKQSSQFHSNEIPFLPATALVPEKSFHYSHHANQSQSRSLHYPNAGNAFNSMNSGPMNTHQQQQYYNHQQPYGQNHHSTLPSRGTNLNSRVVYPQISNGYGYSSMGKASAVAAGFGSSSTSNNNHRQYPPLAYSHMAAYHTKVLPSNEQNWDSVHRTSLANEQLPKTLLPDNQSNNSKMRSGSHHEMSTEL